ncbi:hypothetical protein IV203_033238 [Nitzschia inconspicua]|uniref:Uncharacterized protein n=1 Tax=Nitzschia inconspicua TaxID=303405 RepID=A0A9K3KL43_9STRA|nr:hypothetical protein IV203_033238 [Nitzschia inconspicua]
MTGDLKDFYLGTPMADYEYMRIHQCYIPDDIFELYNLATLLDGDYVYVEIRRGIVKYVNQDDVDHLLTTLRQRYECKADWEGTQYCGLTLEWDYEARTCDISMPGFVERALARFAHPIPTHPDLNTLPTPGSNLSIANDTVKQKRSKAMDMRFYWIRDRVGQNQFHIVWRKARTLSPKPLPKLHPLMKVSVPLFATSMLIPARNPDITDRYKPASSAVTAGTANRHSSATRQTRRRASKRSHSQQTSLQIYVFHSSSFATTTTTIEYYVSLKY